MHFIASSEKTKEHLSSLSDRKWTVIRYFFDFRAEKGITNNFEGFLRSLAAQLAKSAGDAHIDMSSLRELLHPDQHRRRPTSPISLPKLREALINVLQTGGGSVLLLLDGLDEFGGDSHGLVAFIKHVASSKCRVCVASRPENPLPSLLKGFPSIEMQKHNLEAIKAYAHVRFGSTSADQDRCDLWAHRVAKRAAGVFLWACFAIDEIIKADDNGLKPDSELMTRRLKAVPQELEGIYARKLELL